MGIARQPKLVAYFGRFAVMQAVFGSRLRVTDPSAIALLFHLLFVQSTQFSPLFTTTRDLDLLKWVRIQLVTSGERTHNGSVGELQDPDRTSQ